MKFPQWNTLFDSKSQNNPTSQPFWDEYWKNWNSEELLEDRKPAAEFLTNHLRLKEKSLRCLDIGGGSGAVSQNVLKGNSDLEIFVADIAVQDGSSSVQSKAPKFFKQDAKEPFSKEILALAPYDRIWICELEYLLSDREFEILLQRCETLLSSDGMIAITSSSVINGFNTLLHLTKSLLLKARYGSRISFQKNGVSRSLSHLRFLARRSLPGHKLSLEKVIKPRKHFLNLTFGRSDAEQYGFVLSRKN